jgi:hypothetical protein
MHENVISVTPVPEDLYASHLKPLTVVSLLHCTALALLSRMRFRIEYINRKR